MNFHSWADSMADYGNEHAEELKAHDTPHTAPQGRPEQGWPVRRCSPEMACWVPEDQSESADMDVALWLLKGLCVVVTALLCAWVIAGAAHV